MNDERVKPMPTPEPMSQPTAEPTTGPQEQMDFNNQKIEAIGTPDGKININYNASNPFGMTVMTVILQTIANNIGEAQAIALLMSIYSEAVGHRPTVMVYDGKRKIFPPKTVDRRYKE